MAVSSRAAKSTRGKKESALPSRLPASLYPVPVSSSDRALQEAKVRLDYYDKQIQEFNSCPTRDVNLYFAEETITLKDGGLIRHATTPEGTVYLLTKDSRWLFLERSSDGTLQTLSICERDGNGKEHLSQRSNYRK